MKKNLRRYHHKIYFPENDKLLLMVAEFFQQLPKVDVTHHGIEQLFEDKRGLIPLPSKKELMQPENTLVEIYEILDAQGNPTGKMQKALIRVYNLNEKYDYAYVIAREGFIISGWALDKGDEHRLTKSMYNYYCPEELKNDIYVKLQEEQKAYKKVEKDRYRKIAKEKRKVEK